MWRRGDSIVFGSGGVRWHWNLASAVTTKAGGSSEDPNVFIVARDKPPAFGRAAAVVTGAKQFARFPSAWAFAAWMTMHGSTDAGGGLPHLYEVSRGNQSMKPYLDIDLPVASVPLVPAAATAAGAAAASAAAEAAAVVEKRNAAVDAAVLRLADAACRMFRSGGAEDDDASVGGDDDDEAAVPIAPLVFSSHGPTKYSFHIIIDGVALANHKECGAFAMLLVDRAERLGVPSWLVSSVDANVYKQTQLLRMVGSTKVGSDRLKTFAPHLSQRWRANSAYMNPVMALFLASLVTFVASCDPPPSSSDAKKAIQCTMRVVASRGAGAAAAAARNTSVAIPHADAALALAYLKEVFERDFKITAPFELRDSDDGSGVIQLTRTAPSECPLCDDRRKHSAEHPFMVIVSATTILWNCRRTPGKNLPIQWNDPQKPSPWAAVFGLPPPPPLLPAAVATATTTTTTTAGRRTTRSTAATTAIQSFASANVVVVSSKPDDGDDENPSSRVGGDPVVVNKTPPPPKRICRRTLPAPH